MKRKFYFNLSGGGKLNADTLDAAIYRSVIVKFRDLFKTQILLLVLISGFFMWTETLNSQTTFCGFDENLQETLEENPGLINQMNNMEIEMGQFRLYNPELLLSGSPYTVPVVFHIIHTGENSVSNISDQLVYDALDTLNYLFRNGPGVGVDVEIEFCLATRDPDGNSTTGINRVNGTGVGGYENAVGIRMNGANEEPIKSLSRWPATDYINIWIVHNITGNAASFSVIYGFASFPGTDEERDGIMCRFDVFSNPALSRILAHEMGHYFMLYHTFHRGCTGITSSSCTVQGDMCCDTKAHVDYSGSHLVCSDTLTCIGDTLTYFYPVSQNHMNYTPNSCRKIFTDEQAIRMQTSIMTSRASLLYSLGCKDPCQSVTAEFSPEIESITTGNTVNFVNLSNSESHFWIVDNQIYNSDTLTYTFTNFGKVRICIEASDSVCTTRTCILVNVFSNLCGANSSICNPEIYGQFQDHYCSVTHSGPNVCADAFNIKYNMVCGWMTKSLTPDLLSKDGINSVFLGNSNCLKEAIVTSHPIDIPDGKTCKISFDYISSSSFNAPFVLLTCLAVNNNNNKLNSDDEIIDTLIIPYSSNTYLDKNRTFF